jgi:mannose-6-phosphate isomerase-like protein (cupin superfamily)
MENQMKHVPPGAGPMFRVIGGDILTVKAAAEDTGGSFTLFETTVPPNGGPPPHIHHREDESFYVIDGEITFTVGDRTVHATPGTFLWAPRDIPHRFRNTGTTDAKMLIIVRPSGFERFIEELSRLPVDGAPDLAGMAAVAERYGLEFVT